MGIIVQKYGGSSLATLDKIKLVAQHIAQSKKNGHDVVVVVSAMGKTTEHLLGMAREISPNPSQRELDMLLTTGERQSISLLSMAVSELGYSALSLTGSQSGIITNTAHNQAKILEIRPYRIEDALTEGKVVIVAGFQGVSYLKEITTLGRGGSDTTALALTAALNALYCEIYSDVDCVFSADPRLVRMPNKIEEITYDQMLEMAENGAKVLAADAIRFAKHYKIKLFSKNSFKATPGTFVTDETILKKVVAVTSEKDLLKVDVNGDKTANFLLYLLKNNIFYHELWQNGNQQVFIFKINNLHQKERFLNHLDSEKHHYTSTMGRVTLIGNQLHSHPEIMINTLNALLDEGISCFNYHLNHIKLNVFVPLEDTDRALIKLHDTFL